MYIYIYIHIYIYIYTYEQAAVEYDICILYIIYISIHTIYMQLTLIHKYNLRMFHPSLSGAVSEAQAFLNAATTYRWGIQVLKRAHERY